MVFGTAATVERSWNMKYEKSLVPVASLEVGNRFEHPFRDDTLCECEHHSLEENLHIIGYTIKEGALHWPVIYLPPDFQIVLLEPRTTFVKLSGKEWINSLAEHHGLSDS